MPHVHQDLKPGTYVEVLTKQQDDGQNFCGTIISAAPNAPDTYIVEYHPGMDNGHHSGDSSRSLTNNGTILTPHIDSLVVAFTDTFQEGRPRDQLTSIR